MKDAIVKSPEKQTAPYPAGAQLKMLCTRLLWEDWMIRPKRPTLAWPPPSSNGTVSTPQVSSIQHRGQKPSWVAISGSWRTWMSPTQPPGTSSPGLPPSTPPPNTVDFVWQKSTTLCGQRRGPHWTKGTSFLATVDIVGNTYWLRLGLRTFNPMLVIYGSETLLLCALNFNSVVFSLKISCLNYETNVYEINNHQICNLLKHCKNGEGGNFWFGHPKSNWIKDSLKI